MYRTAADVLTIHPDTGDPESRFRAQVRELLNLDWSARDAQIFAELRRLKGQDMINPVSRRRLVDA